MAFEEGHIDAVGADFKAAASFDERISAADDPVVIDGAMNNLLERVSGEKARHGINGSEEVGGERTIIASTQADESRIGLGGVRGIRFRKPTSREANPLPLPVSPAAQATFDRLAILKGSGPQGPVQG